MKFEGLPIEQEQQNKESEIKNDLSESLEAIKKTGLFDNEYLKNITLISCTKEEAYKFSKGNIRKIGENEDFDWDDFTHGRRTDFVGIEPKNYFTNRMEKIFKEREFLDLLFFESPLTYDEFIAHEMAHNIFDIEYKKKFGEYEEKDGLTDVSEEYREKIKNVIMPLLEKYYTGLEAEEFPFNRQQIAEIFAFIHEREFCSRANQNLEMHNRIGEIASKFSKNPQQTFAEFNQKNNRNFSVDKIYKENHTLSIIITSVLEKEYPGWEERKNIFWK